MVTPDVVRQFVAVDVGQTTVLVRGLAVTETEAHFDLVLQLLANASLGGPPPTTLTKRPPRTRGPLVSWG
jgi:hypothetical protein